MNTNISVRTEQALSRAEEVDNLISSISQDLATMKDVIDRTIPTKVNTDWANDLKSTWNRNYNESIKDALAQMQLSASNIRAAVSAARQFTQSV